MKFEEAEPNTVEQILQQAEGLEIDALAFGGSTFDIEDREFALNLLRSVDADSGVSGVIESGVNDTGDNGSLSEFGSSTEEETDSVTLNSNPRGQTARKKILLGFKLLSPTTAKNVRRLTGEKRNTLQSEFSRYIRGNDYARVPQYKGEDEEFNGCVCEITQKGLDHIEEKYGDENYVSAGFLYDDYGEHSVDHDNFQIDEKSDTIGEVQAVVLQAIDVLDDFNPVRDKRIPLKQRLGVTAFEVNDFLDADADARGTVNHLQRKNMIRYTGHKDSGRWSYCLTVKGKRTLRDLDFDPRTAPRWPTSIRRGSSTSKTRKTS